jgi:small subunit ribosomal protein S16
VATKIKLQRLGKMREPHYRIVIADARNKRDGRVIESIGQYHPKSDPSVIVVDGDRAKYWLGVGAQPTEAVLALLKVTGDWQDFKGLPAPPPMLFAPPKPDKKALYEAAVLGANAADDKPALTPRKKAAAKAEAPAVEAPVETPAPEVPAAAEAPAAETPAVEAPAAEAAEAPAAAPEA